MCIYMYIYMYMYMYDLLLTICYTCTCSFSNVFYFPGIFNPYSFSFSLPFLCSRYVYCSKCFIEIPGDSVSVGDDPNSIQTFTKSLFREMKNNSVGQEPYV